MRFPRLLPLPSLLGVVLVAVPAGAATVVLEVGSSAAYTSLQAAVDACPSAGCEIRILDSVLVLPREVWIEKRTNLSISRSSALAAAGIRPRLVHPPGFDPFSVAGTSHDPTDPLRPAGWHRWPNSCLAIEGGSLDTLNPHSTSGFQQTGMIVVSSSSDILLEGLLLDGRKPSFLLNKKVWECRYDVLFGNVGLNLLKSGRVTVRDLEMRGFYAAIYLHGRNLGGATASPNPADLDYGKIEPYSRYGTVGDHLIEGNRIHGNVWALFDEMEWDIGSTIRRNRVWNNANSAYDSLSLLSEEGQYATGGFLLLKDVSQAIHRIHNNTLWAMPRIVGNAAWRAGSQHMFYNNLVGGFDRVVGEGLRKTGGDFTNHLPNFAEWMEHNVFELGDSARRDTTFARTWGNFRDSALCTAVYGIPSSTCLLDFDSPVDVRVPRNMGWPRWSLQKGGTYLAPFDGRWYPILDPQGVEFFPGGGWISGSMGSSYITRDIRSAANRWVHSFPLRFDDSTSPRFLEPLWEDPVAMATALGTGAPTSGWTAPDIGAIPRSGLHPLPWGIRSQERLDAVGGGCYQTRLVSGPGGARAGASIRRARLWSAPTGDLFSASSVPLELPMRPLEDSSWTDGGVRRFCSDSVPRAREGIRLHVVLGDASGSLSEEAHFLLSSSEIRYPVGQPTVPRSSPLRIAASGTGILVSGLEAGSARITIRGLDGRLRLRENRLVPGGVLRLDGVGRGSRLVQVEQESRSVHEVVVLP